MKCTLYYMCIIKKCSHDMSFKIIILNEYFKFSQKIYSFSSPGKWAAEDSASSFCVQCGRPVLSGQNYSFKIRWKVKGQLFSQLTGGLKTGESRSWKTPVNWEKSGRWSGRYFPCIPFLQQCFLNVSCTAVQWLQGALRGNKSWHLVPQSNFMKHELCSVHSKKQNQRKPHIDFKREKSYRTVSFHLDQTIP